MFILGVATLFPPHASAEALLRDIQPYVSPLDKEQDRQNKMRQQENIDRELDAQRRRVLKEAERNRIKEKYEVSPNSPHKKDDATSPARPSN